MVAISAAATYEKLPSLRFRVRLLFVILPIAWMSFLAVGIAGYSKWNPLPPTSHVDRENPTGVTTAFYRNYVAAWNAAPEGCVHGQVQSDFQRDRCTQFWERIAQASVIAFAPLAVIWLAYALGMDALRGTYRRVRKKIETKKALGRGVVAKRALIANDFFGWYYGFRSVQVQVERGAMARVYFPRSERKPVSGDGVAIFEVGSRYFGIYYSPHVAVIAGMTQS